MPRRRSALAFSSPIGELIRVRRNTLGMSQKDVDERIGRNPRKRYIAKIESGQVRKPSFDQEELIGLASCLEISLEEVERAYKATLNDTPCKEYRFPEKTLPPLLSIRMTPKQLHDIATAFEKIGAERFDLSQVIQMGYMLNLDMHDPKPTP